MMYVIYNGYELCEEISEAEARKLNSDYSPPFPWAEKIDLRPGESLHQATDRAWKKRQESGKPLP